MNCAQTRSRLQAFLDGELEEAISCRLAEHLRECDGCRSAYEERRQLVSDLRDALAAEERAPASLAAAVAARLTRASRPSNSRLRRLFAMRSFRIAMSAATVLAVGLIVTWMLFWQDLAFAHAIDKALAGIKSAHFTAVEGRRTVEVWATPEAERVSSAEGWMVATDGRAYLFDRRARRVVITHGAVAHLKLLRSLNALLLSERLRGKALGKPTVKKETVTLPDGRQAIRISAAAKAKHEGVACAFSGSMLVDSATNLIMSGEASETVPNTAQAQRLVQQGKLRDLHVRVEHVEYNQPVPVGAFDISVPKGWRASHR